MLRPFNGFQTLSNKYIKLRSKAFLRNNTNQAENLRWIINTMISSKHKSKIAQDVIIGIKQALTPRNQKQKEKREINTEISIHDHNNHKGLENLFALKPKNRQEIRKPTWKFPLKFRNRDNVGRNNRRSWPGGEIKVV